MSYNCRAKLVLPTVGKGGGELVEELRALAGDNVGTICFDNIPKLVHEGVPPEVFLALSFDGNVSQGTVTFHEGFKADGQQKRAGDA